MNKPISRFPCGDMGLNAGGGHPTNPYPGFWNSSDGDLSLDAIGPVRITGRLGHGYALSTEREDPFGPYNPNAGGVYAGDNFPINWNRGLETVGVGDPEVDYFLPTGFVMRAYLALDRMTEIGDINYNTSTQEGGGFCSFQNQTIGVSHTGEIKFFGGYVWHPTGVFIGTGEYNLYEIYVEYRNDADDRTTSVALRVNEVVVAAFCTNTMTYEGAPVLRASYRSYSSGVSVDDVAFDAITSGVGNWIGPGECAIVRPVAEVSRASRSWASGTDFSPENGDPDFPFDTAHPQCTPGVRTDWYEALAYEIPYRPVNYGAESGFVGGSGADFAIDYAMSNPGADPIAWEDGIRATCKSLRRAADGHEMVMELGDPGFSPNFSRTFVYASRTERIYLRDDTVDSEKLISGLEVNMGYAAVYNFGLESAGDNRWALSTQYLDSDAEDLTMVIRREINLPNVGVSVYAAGSQTAIDSAPGPALPVCTPTPGTTGPIICFV